MRAFVSHSYADASVIDRLRLVAVDRELEVLPPVTISMDDFVSLRLIETILGCGELIYIDADRSNWSFWVAFEIDFARRNGKTVFRFDPVLNVLVEDHEPSGKSKVAFLWRPVDQDLGSQMIKLLPPELQFDIVNHDSLLRGLGELGFPGMTLSASGCSVFLRSNHAFPSTGVTVPDGIERLISEFEALRQFRLARHYTNKPPIIIHVMRDDEWDSLPVYEMLVPGISVRDLCFLKVDHTENGRLFANKNQFDHLCAQICWRNTRERYPGSSYYLPEADITLSGVSLAVLENAERETDNYHRKQAARECIHARRALMQALVMTDLERQLSATVAAHDSLQLVREAEIPDSRDILALMNALNAHISAELSKLYLLRSKGIVGYNLLFVLLHAFSSETYFRTTGDTGLVALVASRAAIAQHRLATLVADDVMRERYLVGALQQYEECLKYPNPYLDEIDNAMIVANAVSALVSLKFDNTRLTSGWLSRAGRALETLKAAGNANELQLLQEQLRRLTLN